MVYAPQATDSWVRILRIVQLIFAIVVLGCSAFGIYYLSSIDAYRLTLFTAIFTVLATVYMLIAGTVGKKLHNIWAILALDILSAIFWVASLGLLANLLVTVDDVFGFLNSYDDNCYGYVCFKKRDLQKRDVTLKNYRDIIAVALAFSVVEFLLFVVTLIAVAIAINRGRKTTAAPNEVAMEASSYEENKSEPARTV